MHKNRSLWQSFRCGFRGMRQTARGRIMRFLFLVFGISMGLGILRGMVLSPLKLLGFVLLIVVVSFLLADECLNTGVEELCDLVEPNHSEQVALIKNCFPAAGLYRGIGAVVGGLYVLIFNPGWETPMEALRMLLSGKLP